ncbi:guanylate kinase [Edaphobacter modestus]|uniref:Guanylate kinase n=1 Tax=Edaphobacter modestus TaxID=388466 RepID=A0A4Q7XXH7_9BACT|nr:guanylate kinase [Edaphobacter modestus]RZU29000.1 guanylate kinase [Edaphobacter modestus]
MSRTIFLIAGPSGSGKTSLTQALVQRTKGLTKGITVTTRVPRSGEISGKDYHFVTPSQFVEMEQAGEFLETDFAYNEWYGVPRSTLDAAGDVALILTFSGALSLKRLIPHAMTLFIIPTCAETAATRVADRHSPNEQARMANYETEVAAARYFDHVILNLDFDQALEQLESVVDSRRQARIARPHSLEPFHHSI